MSFTKTLMATVLAASFAVPAFADGMVVQDAYFRTSGAMAKSGAAFMDLINQSDQDDRLIAASSDLAMRVELHTHKETGDGIMQMVEVEEGFPIAANGMHSLARGGDHVMFMGLTRAVEDGDVITVTLTFEQSGDLVVEIPVDLTRQDGMSQSMNGNSG